MIDIDRNVAKALRGAGPGNARHERKSAGLVVIEDGKHGRDVTADYNQITYSDHESGYERRAKIEMWIAKAIGTRLGRKYPNRQWAVKVDIEGQYLVILCPSVSIKKGHYMHFGDGTIHDLETRAVKAAGEILERHGVARTRRFDEDILETLDRDFLDEVVTDSSEPEPI